MNKVLICDQVSSFNLRFIVKMSCDFYKEYKICSDVAIVKIISMRIMSRVYGHQKLIKKNISIPQ